jgi:hypothetical protein
VKSEKIKKVDSKMRFSFLDIFSKILTLTNTVSEIFNDEMNCYQRWSHFNKKMCKYSVSILLNYGLKII